MSEIQNDDDGMDETSPDGEFIDLTQEEAEKVAVHPERRASDQILKQVADSVDKMTATAGTLVSAVNEQNKELRLVREQAARDRVLLRNSRIVTRVVMACLVLLVPILGLVAWGQIQSGSTAHDAQTTAKVLQECLTPGYECNGRLNELNSIRDELTVQQISLDRLNTSIEVSQAAANVGSSLDAVRLAGYKAEKEKVEQTIAALTVRRNELLTKPFPGLPKSAQTATTTPTTTTTTTPTTGTTAP